VIKGIRTGIVTTRYPEKKEETPGTSPGLPEQVTGIAPENRETESRCPTGALSREKNRLNLRQERCIHCFRCSRGTENPIPWKNGFEWAEIRNPEAVVPASLRHSLHIRVVDAGDCGACLNEIKLLNNPYYNMHRLGFFITPTPRQADILLVAGPVAEHMKTPLLKAYEAMPAPKRVMAVGACALNGGVFGPGFVTGSGVADILPVDIEIPGCPPPPLAILHGLCLIAGQLKNEPNAATGTRKGEK